MARVVAVLAGTIVLIATYASPAHAMIVACEWEKVSTWSTGFEVKVTLITDGGGANGWTATWVWDDATKVTNAWDAIVFQSGQGVSARNQPYNGSIPSFGRRSFGFLATGANDGHGGGLSIDGGPLLPC
jgi:hypothetical protein